MKTSLIFLALLAAGTVNAQSPGPADAQSPVRNDALETRLSYEARATLAKPESPALNRILGQRFIYTGIAVEMIRADNPLQMLNPFAPERYGDAEQNVVRDPITGHVDGLKIFCVSF
jgi:hypothetical protein